MFDEAIERCLPGAEKDGDSMYEIQSTRDAILVSIPMLALVVLHYFRLDHLLARGRGRAQGSLVGHPLSQVQATGRAECVEPGTTRYMVQAGNEADLGVSLASRHVTPYWSEKDCWE